MILADFSLVDCSDGSEEIGSVSTIGMDETKIFKVSSSFSSRTVVDDSTFCNDSDFVVEVVDTVTSLIETDYRGVVFDISEGSENLVELESGVGVETTGSVIPELDGSFGSQHFGD